MSRAQHDGLRPRSEKAVEPGEIVVSLKSVNHRGLDMHFLMPPELDALETRAARRRQGRRGARPHRRSRSRFTRTAGAAARLNRPLLDAYIAAFREAAGLYGLTGQAGPQRRPAHSRDAERRQRRRG